METLQKKLNKIQTELSVPKNQRNTFGNYNYRSCEDILEAVKPLLKETELTLVVQDDLVNIGTRFYVKAVATLSDGKESITATAYARESETKKGMDESQITGAASSYARKYSLNGLLLIDDTKDADSTNKHEKSESKPETKPEQKPSNGNGGGNGKTLMDSITPLAQRLFADPDQFQRWRVEHGLAESLKDCTELARTNVLIALKKMDSQTVKK